MDRPRLSMKSRFGRLSFWLFAAFGICAAVFLLIAVNELRDGRRLAAEGVDTQGMVVDHRISTGTRSRGRTVQEYHVTLRYSVPGAENRRAEQGVSRGDYDRMSVGSTVAMRYAASDPSIIELNAGATFRGGLLLAAAGAIFGVSALVSLVIFGRTTGEQVRAARDGERRVASVVAHHRQGKKRSKLHQVEWSSGSETGRTTAVPESRLPPVGSDIALFVDPRSGRAFWEGVY